jgi:hypothetical protein
VKDGAKARYTHHVTIRDLKPETKYTFRIAGAINGKAVDLVTPQTLKIVADIKTPDPAYGLVNGVNAKDSFVVLWLKNPTGDTLRRISAPVSTAST